MSCPRRTLLQSRHTSLVRPVSRHADLTLTCRHGLRYRFCRPATFPSRPPGPAAEARLRFLKTGGVTLTLSLAYLSVLAHQRAREEQSRSLRASTIALQSVLSPVPQPLPPSRAEIASAKRKASIEGAKDRWNEEIEKAVRWMQMTDWTGIREDLEAHVAAMWVKAFGEAAEGAGRASDAAGPLVGTAKATAGEARGSISAAAKSAYGRASEADERAASVLEYKASDTRVAGRRAAARDEEEIQEKASAAQGVIASALERGRDRAQAMVGRVKTAVGMGGEAAGVATTTAVKDEGLSPVQKALQQRFEKADAKAERTVAEVLSERYTRMDQRDNTVLRGL